MTTKKRVETRAADDINEALDTLVKLMSEANNDAERFAAANAILSYYVAVVNAR